MNFSEEWKSLWPISSIHSPPLLLSGTSVEPILGPLLFSPSPNSLTLLISSYSLKPPFLSQPSLLNSYKAFHSLTRPAKDPYLLPSSATFLASALSQEPLQNTTTKNNVLQFLRCPNDDVLVFFPCGDNWDRVGFVKLLTKGSKGEVVVVADDDVCGREFAMGNGLGSQILEISVVSTAVADVRFDRSASIFSGNDDDDDGDNLVSIGFLLARTLYSVHWFRVKVTNRSDSGLGRPVLEYLGGKLFPFLIASACWNWHLVEESLVLLENGNIYLFDLGSCCRASKFPLTLKGMRVPISWEDLDSGSGLNSDGDAQLGGWLKCESGWHPRIFVVACSSAVFMVDWRFEQSNVTILAQVSTLGRYQSVENDQFVAFCKAGPNDDGYYFSIATEHHLYLLDARKPSMPLLQWEHGLYKPRYINVYKLSELRCSLQEEENSYSWASESGFSILLGSFFDCEFNLFCYGPPLPTPCRSFTSKVSNLCNSWYAWGIPSKLSVLDHQCHGGDCLLAKDLFKTTLHKWVDWRKKDDMVLGFCIIGEDFSNAHVESGGGLGGFTLIKLMSSGKLKSQRYDASWDLTGLKSETSMDMECSNGSRLNSLSQYKYKYPRKFKYAHLKYLIGYLNGNLSEVMISRMRNPDSSLSKTVSCMENSDRVKNDKFKVAGADSISSPSAIADLLNSICLPMSIYEIALSKMWARIPADFLQLAFSSYFELRDVYVDKKKMPMRFLNIPNLPLFPPFFLRKPSSQSNRLSQDVLLDDGLLGPVLPLPILLTLAEVRKDNNENFEVLNDEKNVFSAENELIHECAKVRKVAHDVISSAFTADFSNSCAVSLDHDGDEMWVPSQEPNCLFLCKPSAFLDDKSTGLGSVKEKSVFEDENYGTFVSKMHDKEASSDPKQPVGLEVFDELCPVKLTFDFPPLDISLTEMKGYNLLKRQFSKWQENFKQYGEFCKASKIQKVAHRP